LKINLKLQKYFKNDASNGSLVAVKNFFGREEHFWELGELW
jgi:hypothetical protein